MPSPPRLLLLLILPLLAVPCATGGLAQGLTRAERPELKVGDSTTFQNLDVRTGEKRDTTFRLLTIDPDKFVAQTSGATSGTQTFTREWNLVEVKTGEVVAATYKPFLPHLQFPLELGRSWNLPFEVEVNARVKRISKWEVKARVAAAEAVTVAAGTYQAFRIEYDDSFATREGNASWTGTQKETVWYAPEVQRIVKRDYEQVVPSRKFLDHHVVEMMSLKLAP